MQIEIAGRGFGKTHRMMQWLEEDQDHEFRVLIVRDNAERDRLREAYPKVSPIQIHTMEEAKQATFRRVNYPRVPMVLGFDNLEEILEGYLYGRVERISIGVECDPDVTFPLTSIARIKGGPLVE